MSGVIRSPVRTPNLSPRPFADMSQLTGAEVKQMAMKMFQQWALAFRSKRELAFFVDVYNELKGSGTSPSCEYLAYFPRYRLPSSTDRYICSPSIHYDRACMDRFGCLHALSVCFHLYQSQAPLPELRPGLRPSMFEPSDASAQVWNHRGSKGM